MLCVHLLARIVIIYNAFLTQNIFFWGCRHIYIRCKVPLKQPEEVSRWADLEVIIQTLDDLETTLGSARVP